MIYFFTDIPSDVIISNILPFLTLNELFGTIPLLCKYLQQLIQTKAIFPILDLGFLTRQIWFTDDILISILKQINTSEIKQIIFGSHQYRFTKLRRVFDSTIECLLEFPFPKLSFIHIATCQKVTMACFLNVVTTFPSMKLVDIGYRYIGSFTDEEEEEAFYYTNLYRYDITLITQECYYCKREVQFDYANRACAHCNLIICPDCYKEEDSLFKCVECENTFKDDHNEMVYNNYWICGQCINKKDSYNESVVDVCHKNDENNNEHFICGECITHIICDNTTLDQQHGKICKNCYAIQCEDCLAICEEDSCDWSFQRCTCGIVLCGSCNDQNGVPLHIYNCMDNETGLVENKTICNVQGRHTDYKDTELCTFRHTRREKCKVCHTCHTCTFLDDLEHAQMIDIDTEMAMIQEQQYQ
jgi:hypothetical protein